MLHTNNGKVKIATKIAAAQRDKIKLLFDIVLIFEVKNSALQPHPCFG
jgi:hypothetical protein